MKKIHIQMAGLVALSSLAAGLLFLIGFTFAKAIDHVTPDGKVPVLDAGIMTALLLSFQFVIGAIRSIWESQERSTLAEGLSQSTPNPVTSAPVTAQAAADKVAGAAQDEADDMRKADT